MGNAPGSNSKVPQARGQVGQPLANTARQKLAVKANTHDRLWKNHADRQPFALKKMDIEGGENEAFDDTKEILCYTHKVVIAAYHYRMVSARPIT